MTLIKNSEVDFDDGLKDDTSLIQSGKLDSVALLNMVLFIEGEVGSDMDLTTFDLSREWDTVADIVRFIVEHRVGEK